MKQLFLITTIFASFLLYSPPVSAASAHIMRVSPSISEVAVYPGGSIEKNISVVNKGDVAFDLKLSTAPYSVINEKYIASFEPLPGRSPVNKWISFDMPDETTVTPGKYYDIKYKLTVPASTAPGGYSAVVFAESTADTKLNTGIVAKNRVAHIVYITVNGDVKKEGKVDLVAVPLIAFGTHQEVRDVASNSGGTNEKVLITTTISDVFGKHVTTDTTERYVLPGTKRAINLEWRSSSVFGIYKIERSALFAGVTTPKVTQWTIIIDPLFLLVSIIFVGGAVWLNYTRTRTMKAQHAKK